jgi:hypothetical protein
LTAPPPAPSSSKSRGEGRSQFALSAATSFVSFVPRQSVNQAWTCRPRRSHANDVNPQQPRHVHKPPAHKSPKRSSARKTKAIVSSGRGRESCHGRSSERGQRAWRASRASRRRSPTRSQSRRIYPTSISEPPPKERPSDGEKEDEPGAGLKQKFPATATVSLGASRVPQ